MYLLHNTLSGIKIGSLYILIIVIIIYYDYYVLLLLLFLSTL